MTQSSRRNRRMVQTRWMFKLSMVIVLAALPGLVFSAGTSVMPKGMAKEGPVQLQSAKTMPAAKTVAPQLQSAAPKVEAPPVAPQANQEMTKAVKSLTEQVQSLKKELDQLKTAGQAQTRAASKKRLVR